MTIDKRDILRAIHSDVVGWITDAKLNGGWCALPDDTFTYASSSTFTVDGDWTDIFTCGVKLRCLNTTQKYFYVISSAYSAPNTTVTITGGSDYTLASADITYVSISYASNPRGFPHVFNWTPTYTGFSTDPTNCVSRFWIIGKICYFEHSEATNGISNADTFHITLPVTAATITNMTWAGVCGYAVNDSSALTGAAKWSITSGATYTNLNMDMAAGVWSIGNGKRARMIGWYAIAA